MKKRILAAVLALMMICSMLPMSVLAEDSGDGTPVPTESVSPVPTETVSPVPTETVSPVPTETVSPVPTETVSPVPTETVSPVPTETVSPVPTETVSPVPTETVSPVPTETVTPTPVATQTPDRGPLMLAPAPSAISDENAQLYAVKDGKIMTELNICIWNGLYVQLYYGDPSDGYDNDIAVNNAVLEGNADLGNSDHTDNGYQINPYKCQMNTASLKYQVDESTTATLAIHGLPKFGAILLEYNNELFDTEYKNIPVGMGGIYAGLYFCDQNGNTVKLTNTSGVTSTDVTVLNYIAEGDNAGKWHIAMESLMAVGKISYSVGGATYNFTVQGAVPAGGGGMGPGPMGPTIPDVYGIFSTWCSPGSEFDGIEKEMPVGAVSPVQLWLGNPSDDVEDIQITGEVTVVGSSAVVDYNKDYSMDGQAYSHVYIIEVQDEGTSYISYVHEGQEYRYNITGILQVFEPVDLLLAKQVNNGESVYFSALEIPYDKANDKVGSMTVEFRFGLEEDGMNGSVALSQLTASGVISLTAADGDNCVVSATEPGYGTISYAFEGKTYSMLVTVLDANGGTGGQKDKYLYALWADDDYNRMYEWEGTPDGSSPLRLFFFDGTNHIQLKQPLQTTGVATAEYHETFPMGNEIYLVGVNALGPGAIVYTHTDGVDYVFPVIGTDVMNEGDASPHYVRLQIGGDNIDIGIGQINQKVMMLTAGVGSAYYKDDDENFSCLNEFVLVALVNSDGTNGESIAPADIYEAITDVSFRLVDAVNEDGTTNPLNCEISETEALQTLGVNTWKTEVSADHGKGFTTKVEMTFTIDLDGEGMAPPETHTVWCDLFYKKGLTQDYIVPVDGTKTMPDGTVITLNWILASTENLEAWMNAFYPEQFQALKNAENPDIVSLVLPAVTYTEVIESHLTKTHGSVQLLGSSEGDTVMPGYVHYSGLAGLENIVFDGNNKDDSVGILAQGDPNYFYFSDLGWIMYCTFIDLDVAIESTETGYAGGIYGNEFYNCTTGILIDCDSEGYAGAANDKIQYNTFNDCKTAIHVEELPSFVTPYSFRVWNNKFISEKNYKDFVVNLNKSPGTYYFYLNYYGKSKSEPRSVVMGGPNNILVTNPCYADEAMTKVTIDNTEGLYAWILEDMAGQLAVDGDMLKQNKGETEISLLNKEGTEVKAVWTFGGNE